MDLSTTSYGSVIAQLDRNSFYISTGKGRGARHDCDVLDVCLHKSAFHLVENFSQHYAFLSLCFHHYQKRRNPQIGQLITRAVILNVRSTILTWPLNARMTNNVSLSAR
jgi:hypothetical protein